DGHGRQIAPADVEFLRPDQAHGRGRSVAVLVNYVDTLVLEVALRHAAMPARLKRAGCPAVAHGYRLGGGMSDQRAEQQASERKSTVSGPLEAFRDGMRDLGYAEGRDLSIDTWWGEGSEQRLEKLSDDIVRSRPDVLVTQGGPALSAMIRAGIKIPIVFSVSA